MMIFFFANIVGSDQPCCTPEKLLHPDCPKRKRKPTLLQGVLHCQYDHCIYSNSWDIEAFLSPDSIWAPGQRVTHEIEGLPELNQLSRSFPRPTESVKKGGSLPRSHGLLSLQLCCCPGPVAYNIINSAILMLGLHTLMKLGVWKRNHAGSH